MISEITLDGESLKAQEVWSFAQHALNPHSKIKIRVAPRAQERIKKAANFVAEIIQGSKAVYGINTGFGKFAEVSIPHDKLQELQRNLILSHACGVGEPLSRDLVLAMWVLRLNTMCRGNSGVRLETVDRIIQLLEAGVLAEIPSRGSVGASGDLSPSAHATLTLLGEGMATFPAGGAFVRAPAQEALSVAGLAPYELGPKEGLSLINGTQLTTALAMKAWAEGRSLLAHANLATALSIEGLRASHTIVSEKVLFARNHPGALECGREISAWLQSPSPLSASHQNCSRVQDPYSLRCAPQVHGCIFDELLHARTVIEREINSSTDNPLLFPEDRLSQSGGNFHALYTARVSDALSSALTTLGSISERRLALAMSPSSSQLPAFLTPDGGLNSGFMMAQVTAAALVSEAKSLSFPASVDSIPTSDDREDHVSMGPGAGFKAVQIAEHIRSVIGIEIFAAAQALHLLAPLQPGARLTKVLERIRLEIPPLARDRILSQDMARMNHLMQTGDLLKL
ncbi:MAG: histidine ammonia-lyase [Bdellovibrionales bacterium]|nr:histidine ammonia-lyase [Bdellovibrionales bacterium]